MSSSLSKIRSSLALEGNVIPLLIIAIIVLTGEKLWDRFLPKYLGEIGASVFIIGSLGFLQNFLGAFAAWQGGILSDKLGERKAFRYFSLLAVVGYIIAIVFTHWIAVFIGIIFFSAWSYISLPGTLALITKTVGKRKAAMGISMHSIVRRIPMMIGPLIGALLIGAFGMRAGIQWAFAVAGVLCLIALPFLRKFPGQSDVYKPLPMMKIWKQMDQKLKGLLFSDIFIRFCEQIPYVFVVIWCLDVLHITPVQFGLLTMIEMIVATLIYIPVARFSDRMERKPFVVTTFIFFTLFPIILFFSHSWGMLIVAFIVRGLKEFGEPTRKALILDLADDDAKARTVGVYYFIRDILAACAALIGGWLWHLNPAFNLWTAAAFGLLGTLLYVAFGKQVLHTVRKS